MLFPTGHGYGLSYSKFEVGDLEVSVDEGLEELEVAVGVSKCGGPPDGEQLVQVYGSQDSPTVQRPVEELSGFAKVALRAGQKQRVQVPVSLK